MSLKIAHDINEKDRTEDIQIKDNVDFSAMLLSENVLKGLKQCGYIQPSPIQLKAIPLGRCGFDLILKAKSGTGKTAVFVITALEMIDLSKNHPQVIILAPTREIAVQIQQVIKHIGAELKGLGAEYFIGGTPLEEDEVKLQNCHIVVGAPGRVKHLIETKLLDVSQVRLFILDEADKLMEISFQQSINWIYNHLPKRKQVMAVSATYPDDLDKFLGNYMLSPTHVNPDTKMPILLGIRQFYTVVKCHLNAIQQMKFKTYELTNILSNLSFKQCLVFSNYQTRAESLSNNLNQQGWPSRFISGQQSQTKRLQAVDDLRKFKCRILSSTDLTARGIDAANVDLVVNYDVPLDVETYLHRMGRAGRYGSYGICITIASEGKELNSLQKIIKQLGNNVAIAKLPDTKDFNDIWDCDLNNLEHLPCFDSDEESDILVQKHERLTAGQSTDKKDIQSNTELSEKVSDLICSDYSSKVDDSDVKSVGAILKSVESQTTDKNIEHNLTNLDLLKKLSKGIIPSKNKTNKGDISSDTSKSNHFNENLYSNNSQVYNFGNSIGQSSSSSAGSSNVIDKSRPSPSKSPNTSNFTKMHGQNSFSSSSTFIYTNNHHSPEDSGQNSFISDRTYETSREGFNETSEENGRKLSSSAPRSSILSTRESTHYEEINLNKRDPKKELPFVRESIRKNSHNEAKQSSPTDNSIGFSELQDKLKESLETTKHTKEVVSQKRLQNECKRWKSSEMMTTSERVYEHCSRECSPERNRPNAMETDEAYQSLSSHEEHHLSETNSGDSKFLFNPVSPNPPKSQSSKLNTLLTKNLALFKITKLVMEKKFCGTVIKDCSSEVNRLLETLQEEDERLFKSFSATDIQNFLTTNKIGDGRFNEQTSANYGPCKCSEKIFSSAYDHALDPDNTIDWKNLLCACHNKVQEKEAKPIQEEFNSENFASDSNSLMEVEPESEEKCTTETCKGQCVDENLFSKAYDRAIEAKIQKYDCATQSTQEIPNEPFGFTCDNDYYYKKFSSSTSAKADKSFQSIDKAEKETIYISPGIQNFVERRNVYSSYYQHYSNVLAETASNFNNVNEFHDWFFKWKEEVEAVRDFVQQDIFKNECNGNKN